MMDEYFEAVRSIAQCRITSRAREVLAGSGAMAVVIAIAVGLLSAPRGIAQQTAEPTARPSFAVASIKPSDPDARGIMIRPGPGGRFSGSNLTLRFLIKFSYDLRDDQISGGPNWLDSKHYDVEANSDPPFGGDPRSMNDAERNEFMRQIRLRLQSLLDDRFQLKISHGTKEMSVYHLVVAKGGPKLKELQGASTGMMFRIGAGVMDLSGADMEGLARALSEMTGRTVIDKTGLTGHYDIKVEFTPDPSLAMGRMMGPGPGGPGGGGPPGGPQPPPTESTGPTLLTALQEQLGLKLESHKGPGDIVNVDSAQFPSEN
jgi:bla regulator protein blaR1